MLTDVGDLVRGRALDHRHRKVRAVEIVVQGRGNGVGALPGENREPTDDSRILLCNDARQGDVLTHPFTHEHLVAAVEDQAPWRRQRHSSHLVGDDLLARRIRIEHLQVPQTHEHHCEQSEPDDSNDPQANVRPGFSSFVGT